MPSLAEAQANFVATINEGPDALDPALFEGDSERILLGLKAHANTISHARLVALEESFPLSRAEMGDTAFNTLTRDYAETAQARALDLNRIGHHFPAFLREQQSDASQCDLAAIEYLWLESYRAQEATALQIADIAKLSEDELMALPVQWHPATRLIELTAPLAATLAYLDVNGAKSHSVLIARPEAEVRLLGLDTARTRASQNCAQSTTIGNLLALASEPAGDADPIGSVLTLIGAGALIVME